MSFRRNAVSTLQLTLNRSKCQTRRRPRRLGIQSTAILSCLAQHLRPQSIRLAHLGLVGFARRFRPYTPTRTSNHAQPNRLVICPRFFLGLTKHHSILKLTKLRLTVCFLLTSRLTTTSLFPVGFLRNRERFGNFTWWRFGHFLNMLDQVRM